MTESAVVSKMHPVDNHMAIAVGFIIILGRYPAPCGRLYVKLNTSNGLLVVD